jgi:hypothetical protein
MEQSMRKWFREEIHNSQEDMNNGWKRKNGYE